MNYKRTKRSTDNNVDNNQDQMSINETNSGQIINGTFTDTSNGAVIPTNQTVSEMNQAGKITGWHVKDNDQTEIPLVWGPKALPPYNPYVFDKSNNTFNENKSIIKEQSDLLITMLIITKTK
ncbi:hypothetical protein EF900_18680 [Staphylococcus aureus]|nr:hypothetical protein EF900_18680 [Staphylococcus aureus]